MYLYCLYDGHSRRSCPGRCLHGEFELDGRVGGFSFEVFFCRGRQGGGIIIDLFDIRDRRTFRYGGGGRQHGIFVEGYQGVKAMIANAASHLT